MVFTPLSLRSHLMPLNLFNLIEFISRQVYLVLLYLLGDLVDFKIFSLPQVDYLNYFLQTGSVIRIWG